MISSVWVKFVSSKEIGFEMSEGPAKRQRKWDLRFLDLAEHISEWSKDPSTKVGAVITLGNRLISVGYNGLPQSVPDAKKILNNREEKYKYIIHAEMNAILTAGRDLTGCTLYTTPFLPCTNCASMVIQSGIVRVVADKCKKEDWKSRIEESKKLFSKANIEVIEY